MLYIYDKLFYLTPRVIVIGTSNFSVKISEKILKKKYNVIGILSITDRLIKKKKYIESSLKRYSNLHALPLLQIQTDNLKNSLVLEILQKWDIEIMIIVDFCFLPKKIWSLPIFGSYNLHPSLLPNYRGSAPIQWAIRNNESITGVTTFQVNERLDMGNFFFKKKIILKKKENAGSLSIRLSEIGSNIIDHTIMSYYYLIIKKQLTPFQVKKAPKLFNFNSKIKWKDSIKSIFDIICGLSPSPGAWFILKKYYLIIKIYRSFYKIVLHTKCIGSIEKNKIIINNGCIFILDYKLEVKKFYGVIAQFG